MHSGLNCQRSRIGFPLLYVVVGIVRQATFLGFGCSWNAASEILTRRDWEGLLVPTYKQERITPIATEPLRKQGWARQRKQPCPNPFTLTQNVQAATRWRANLLPHLLRACWNYSTP